MWDLTEGNFSVVVIVPSSRRPHPQVSGLRDKANEGFMYCYAVRSTGTMTDRSHSIRRYMGNF